MRRRPANTVFEYCVARQGVMKGARTCSFIVCWAIAAESLGHDLGEGQGIKAAVQEYAEYWGDKERTVYNRLSDFRAIFPHESPQVMVDHARATRVEAAAITAMSPTFALA